MSLIQPIGGTLVNREITKKSEINDILSHAVKNNLKKIEISRETLLELECIANGAFSPLIGFPTIHEIKCVMNTWRLSNGVPFGIPPIFPVSKEAYDKIKVGETLILIHDKKNVGLITVDGKSEINKEKKEEFMKKIYRTNHPDHPGVKYINHISDYLISGEINNFGEYLFFDEDSLSPRKCREEFEKRGWNTIALFSTTNVPHSAHEYLHRLGLDMCDGLMIHTLNMVSSHSSHKYDLETMKQGTKALVDNYYPTDHVIFTMLPIIAKSSGPREAVFQAVVRQNYGCTHFIMGRDHAGFRDVYGKYESQQIFDKFPELKIKVIPVLSPSYCKKCKLIVTEKNCGHSEKDKEEISGTRVRQLIKEKKEVPEFLMRKEVVDVIRKSMN